MASNVITDYSNVIMPKFKKNVVLYMNTKMPLLKFMNEGKQGETFTMDGESNFYFPYQSALPEGGAWVVENSTNPTATSPAFAKPYLSYKKYVHAIQMSQETMKLTKSKPNALKDGLKTNMTGAVLATKLNVEAALHGDGSGALATCVSYSGQVVTVDSTRFIRPGMVLDGYGSDDNQDANGIVVTKINSSTTFTCTGTVTGIDSDTRLFLEGSWVTGLDRAANGLDNIVDDAAGTFQGLARATYPEMCAHVTDGDTPGTNQAFTEQRLRGVFDDVMFGRAGEAPDWIYTSIGCRNAYADYLKDLNMPTQGIPNKTGTPGEMWFYYEGKHIPLFGSVRAIPNTMFALSNTGLFKYFGDMGWFTVGSGSPLVSLQAASTSTLGVIAHYYAMMNFGSDKPEKNGRLNDVTEV